MTDKMSNTAAQEAATRDAHLWAAVISMLSSLTAQTGIGYQSLTVEPGRMLHDDKVAKLISRYMAPSGEVFEIEHTVTVNYVFRKAADQ